MNLSGNSAAMRAVGASVVLVAFLLTGPPVPAQETYVEIMRFAADMARRGNWREAKFRWEKAARLAPDNAKILNNLGVALEALGEPDAARATYDKARALTRGNTVIDTNRLRAERFWAQVQQQGDGEVPTYDIRGMIPGDPEGAPPGKKKKGKSFKVTVELPVPARLDLAGKRTLLVASFLTDESHLLDINRELVRFIRSEYRKHSDLEVLPVTPAPAVPEQTLSDLIANREFWKFLGREYGADVIVSGVMEYDRRDSSGFRDVDVISPSTGQKVRQSQFVEQERFLYELDIIFMDGATGELLFRDRLQRSALFRGTQNDPITAFFDLSETIAPDVLAIVKSRTREDVRFVFKK
jgi:hypothetical protein